MTNLLYYVAVKNIEELEAELSKITNNMQLVNESYTIYQRTINMLAAVANFYQRLEIKKVTIPENENEIFLAFKYANNQVKHDVCLLLVHKNQYGSTYSKIYPYKYGLPHVLWRDFKDNSNKKSNAKREHYDKVLKSKELKATLLVLKELLEKYSEAQNDQL